MEPRKVFISHSWQDKPLVRQLETELRKAGIQVWVDHKGVRAGDNLPEEISNALQWCDTLLLIWSGASENSYWVKIEWTNALALRKVIIPLIVDETALPSILSHKVHLRLKILKQDLPELVRALTDVAITQAPPNVVDPSTSANTPDVVKGGAKPESSAVPNVIGRAAEFLRKHPIYALLGLTLILVLVSIALGLNYRHKEQNNKYVAPDYVRKETTLLILIDTSKSVNNDQLRELVEYAGMILDDVPAGSEFQVLSMTDHVDPQPLVSGTTPNATSTLEQERLRNQQVVLLQQKINSYEVRSKGANYTCIIGALSFSQRHFSQMNPAEQNLELVMLSDMQENCLEEPSLHRKVILDNSNIGAEIKWAQNLPSFRDLSRVSVTMLLPPSLMRTSIDPQSEDLDRFWQVVLTKFGFSNEMLSDPKHYFFSNTYPRRFRTMKTAN